jgi:hypothetical protein
MYEHSDNLLHIGKCIKTICRGRFHLFVFDEYANFIFHCFQGVGANTGFSIVLDSYSLFGKIVLK